MKIGISERMEVGKNDVINRRRSNADLSLVNNSCWRIHWHASFVSLHDWKLAQRMMPFTLEINLIFHDK